MTTVRSVRTHELGQLLDLYRMLNPEDPELSRTESLRQQWREMLADEDLDIVVVEHDGRLVSSCVLSITKNLTRNARPFAVIENVITHAEYRGNGFGTRCVETAIDRAKRRDCYKVMLLTGTDREWKLEFYERRGFDRDEKTGFVLDFRD